MKTFILVTFLLSLNLTPSASAISANSGADALLSKIHKLAIQCVYQPFEMQPNGIRRALPSKSLCSELKKVSPFEAIILIEGQKFVAKIAESPLSDGGDLYDLTVENEAQEVIIVHKAILSFGDILVSLTEEERN